MYGYWNNSEETKLAFRDGFFRTGDVGYRDANGYFYILNRLKDMIVTGGENVYSGEVEPSSTNIPLFISSGLRNTRFTVGRSRCDVCRAEVGKDLERGRIDRSLSSISRQLQDSTAP
jgi:acyl-CoA synthetase (AMP-forming)/AMP-acid ligase II